jgi:hypothetical protein
MPPAANRMCSAIQRIVSRVAGASLRCMRSFITLRGTSVWYHSAAASPASMACLADGPVRE